MFSESHCHLGEIKPEVVKQAEEQGFSLLLTSGIDLPSSELAVKIANKYDIVKACLGIHPWYADEWGADVKGLFRDLSESSEVVAISEIGLDFTGRMTKNWIRDEKYVDKEIQRNAFKDQILLAEKLDLPVLVHDRVPDQEVLDILEETNTIETRSAIHGFSKGLDYASRCQDLGIYLSIGLRTITNPPSGFFETVKEVPMEWLLTETDSNDPHGVLTVCEKIGEIKDLTREEVGTTATKNLETLIGISS